MKTRRELLTGALSCVMIASQSHITSAEYVSPHPNRTKFESGDFLWPARAGAFIPYDTGQRIELQREIEIWENGKLEFLNQVSASNNGAMRRVGGRLDRLTFQEFYNNYFNGVQPGERIPYGAALPQVGHVALVDIESDGEAWVIEAIPRTEHRYQSIFGRFPMGVVRTLYQDWIVEHEKYNVWHGRLKDLSKYNRRDISETAKQFVGRDYWFWSLDLSDETAFYCSKLIWLSVWKALKIPIDGNSELVRSFWVSPKQLITSNAVTILHNPGAYGRN